MITPEVAQAIMALSEVHGGRLTPEQVVTSARDRRSPLHGCFVWDDKKASEAYRLLQARVLVKSVRLEVTTESLTTPRRIPAFGLDKEHHAYATLDLLRQDEDAAREAAIAEFARAASALRRARAIAIELDLGAEAHATISALVRNIEQGAESILHP